MLLRGGMGYTKPPPGAQINWGHPLAWGLVGCWLFNEGAGIRANDLASGKHGTLTNGPLWQGAGGIRFDGSNDLVLTTNTDSFTNSLTMESWVYMPAANLAAGVYHGIFGRGGGTGPQAISIEGATGQIWMYLNGFVSGATVTPEFDRWCHVLVTANQSARRLYIDGRLRHGPTSGALNISSVDPIRIGRYYISTIKGSIRMARMWNRVLTPGEVAQLYAEPYTMIQAPAARRYFASFGNPWWYYQRQAARRS